MLAFTDLGDTTYNGIILRSYWSSGTKNNFLSIYNHITDLVNSIGFGHL